MREGLQSAEAVARAYLEESDPAKRLQWVRNAEQVKARLAEYPEEARTEVGVIEKVLGHQADGGCAGREDEASHSGHAELPPALHAGNRAPRRKRRAVIRNHPCLAVGWIINDPHVEDEWIKRQTGTP
jgi:hypothetical protein